MKTRLRKYMIGIMIQAIMSSLVGCNNSIEQDERATNTQEFQYNIYCVNETGTRLDTWGYNLSRENMSTEEMMDELIKAFCQEPLKEGCTSANAGKVTSIKGSLKGDLAIIDCDKNYDELDSLKQMFYKAAMVLTLTQIDDIDYVYMSVDGKPMLDADEKYLGRLNQDNFVLYDSELNSNESELEVTLYYANSDGDMLTECTHTCTYDGSVSREQFVLEQLKSEPMEENMNRTIPEDMIIKDVYTKNGTCYVNLDSSINSTVLAVTEPYIMFYSIVNTLTELNGITKVQVLIDGKTDVLFGGKISLKKVYGFNLYILEEQKE